MKIMNLSKDRETQQQSYFYVVWPEDKSPGGTSVAATTLSSTAAHSSAAATSTALSSTPMPPLDYDTHTNSSNDNCSISNLHQGSPVESPLRKEAVGSMASEQVMTTATNSSSQNQEAYTKLASCSNTKSQPVQHVIAAMPSSNNMTVSILPPLDSFITTNSSIGRQRTGLTPDFTPFGKTRVHGMAGGETN